MRKKRKIKNNTLFLIALRTIVFISPEIIGIKKSRNVNNDIKNLLEGIAIAIPTSTKKDIEETSVLCFVVIFLS